MTLSTATPDGRPSARIVLLRGFDAAGKQVWGAVTGPYRFVKESPAASGAHHLDEPVGDEAAVVAPAKEPQ